MSDRVDRLLPMLRCPRTLRPLRRDGADRLVAVPAAGEAPTIWPVVDGVPSFLPPDIPVHQTGESLTVCDYVAGASVYAKFTGPALNLSAGNTANKPANMIEADVVRSANTDVLLDTDLPLPFADDQFEFVICMNAFEHYRHPQLVADEILRVLRPGGEAFVTGAFLSPLHLAPFHFYGATRHGYAQWFSRFDVQEISVPWNFNPYYTLTWIVSDIGGMLREHAAPAIAERFERLTVADLIGFWRAPEQRDPELYDAFMALPEPAKERTAVGFYVKAFKPQA